MSRCCSWRSRSARRSSAPSSTSVRSRRSCCSSRGGGACTSRRRSRSRSAARSFAFAVLAFVTLAMYVGSELHGRRGRDSTLRSSPHRTLQALRISAVVGAGAMLAYGVTLVAKRSSAGMIVVLPAVRCCSPLINPAKGPFRLDLALRTRPRAARGDRQAHDRQRRRPGPRDPYDGRRSGPDAGVGRGRRRRIAAPCSRAPKCAEPGANRYRRRRWPSTSTSSSWAPGPAGTAAAITAATHGLHVVCVDKAQLPARQDVRRRAHGQRAAPARDAGRVRRRSRRDAEPAFVRETVLVSPSGRRVTLPMPDRRRARRGRRAAGRSTPRSSPSRGARGVDVREGCAIEDVKQVGERSS